MTTPEAHETPKAKSTAGPEQTRPRTSSLPVTRNHRPAEERHHVMDGLQKSVARSLSAHHDDYPEAQLAIQSMALDLADAIIDDDDQRAAFLTACGIQARPEFRADRAIPREIRVLLAAGEAALLSESPGAGHDALRNTGTYLKNLYALKLTCAACGAAREWAAGPVPGLCRNCAAIAGNQPLEGPPGHDGADDPGSAKDASQANAGSGGSSLGLFPPCEPED